jgi:hypothetical protein
MPYRHETAPSQIMIGEEYRAIKKLLAVNNLNVVSQFIFIGIKSQDHSGVFMAFTPNCYIGHKNAR